MDGERLTPGVVLGLGRFHIVLIAALAAVAFAWQFDARLVPALGLVVGADWFLLNLWNRLADVPEDLRNGVAGTAFAARHHRLLNALAWTALLLSFALALPFGWRLVALRALFQLGGLAYSFRVLPGRRRVKDLYLSKNVASGLLFILTVVGYPLALRHGGRPLSSAELGFLVGFFLPLEITYEVIYDLRDVAGDRAEGIPTVPVVFGERPARALVWALIALSAASLLAGYGAGALSWAELIMVAACVQQAIVMAWPLRRSVTARAAIGLTYLGAVQLASFLAWIAVGLPTRRPW